MVFYRVIHYGKNMLISNIYDTLKEAYSNCIPLDETDACRRLLNNVTDEILKGERYIRISCNRLDTWWIQLVDTVNEPIPPPTKIDCCHSHI